MNKPADIAVSTRSPTADHPEPSWLRRWWRCWRWTSILQLALVLWIVRVPLTMTVLGFVILGLVPPAQDLFVEFASRPAWPAILLQSDSLLAEVVRFPLWRILLFVVFIVVIWAVPTHYAARLLLDTDARFRQLAAAQRELPQGVCLAAMERSIPCILGLLTFVAVLIGIWRSHVNVPILDETSVTRAVDRWLLVVALLVLAGAGCFIAYTMKRPLDADRPVVHALKRMNTPTKPVWRAIAPGLRAPPGSPEEASRDLGRTLIAGVFLLFLAIFALGADFAAWLFPRAMAVPFILGGWLPFLSYLAGAGRHLRAPLIFGLFVVVAVLAVVLGDNHSVRLVDAAKAAGRPIDVTHLPLDAAVKMWMQENKCDGAPETCPRPVIIAAAGGGGRAAFFTATILGYLMQEAPERGLDANQMRNRLFAISAVSGGSVGATMATAALDAKNDSTDHPCVQSPFGLWWGQKINNWRDCFEALASGDFITGVFFGFAFNDTLPFGFWRDRAAVLEDSFSARYDAVVTRADVPSEHPGCKGLRCPFYSLRPRPGHWIPLLVLNAASEATGGRIVTTLLAPTYTPAAPCPTLAGPSGCTLFPVRRDARCSSKRTISTICSTTGLR